MYLFNICLGKDCERQVKYLKDKLSLLGDFQINVIKSKTAAKVIITALNVEFAKSIIKDCIADLILLFFKYDIFGELNNLKDFNLATYALIGAVLSFDKKNEKRLVLDNLQDFENEINVEGFFNFSLDLIRERWNEFLLIMQRLYDECYTENDVYELISFIMSSEIGYGNYVKIDKDNNIIINNNILPTVNFTDNSDANLVISILKERPISITIQSPKNASKNLIETISNLGDKI